MRRYRYTVLCLGLLLTPLCEAADGARRVSGAPSVRVKDITSVAGVRENQLIGVGLVVGLNGTGDSSNLALQMAQSMLERMELSVPAQDLAADNIAAVVVTATLGPFAKKGTRLDVSVASMVDASSLQGGKLLQTPLKGADNEVYVVAQGEISIGGYSVGGTNASVQKGLPTGGRIPNGGIVEEEVPCVLETEGTLQLTLAEPDFTSAMRLADVVNQRFPGSAAAMDGASVEVAVPEEYFARGELVRFISTLGEMQTTPDVPACVLINEKTGTIVVHQNVRISPVGISHGNITVVITEDRRVSQPQPFSDGTTEITSGTGVEVQEHEGHLQVFEPGVRITDLADALNKLGVTPLDMITIFQAIKASGALHAELKVI